MTSFKRIAVVAALGSVMIAGGVYAATANEKPVEPTVETKSTAEMTPSERRYEALARILSLSADQRPAWQAYVNARHAAVLADVNAEGPVIDIQDRLDRLAEHAQKTADMVKTLASTRADLLKVLRPDQKYVLEMHEMQHDGRRAGSRFHEVHGYCMY